MNYDLACTNTRMLLVFIFLDLIIAAGVVLQYIWFDVCDVFIQVIFVFLDIIMYVFKCSSDALMCIY